MLRPKDGFKLDLVEPIKIVRQDTDAGRFYLTPRGDRYPSVTSVLGKGSDNSWLKDWYARVGEREAKGVSQQSTSRGTAVHDIAENYVLGRPLGDIMPGALGTFKTIKPFLDEHLELVHGVELQMYSDRLRVAGTTDMIGIWDGKLSVIDYKTSKYEKDQSAIRGYFMQGSAYADMYDCVYGSLPEQIVIIMAVHNAPSTFYTEPVGPNLAAFEELRNSVID